MRTATSTSNRILREDGMALITTILVMMLCSALMVGFVSAIVADQRASGLDRDQTQAYAVAHAGLEQLTSELSVLFTTDFSPNKNQVDALMNNPPSLPGFQYHSPDGTSGYRVGPALGYAGNAPISDPNGTISAGPYQGFRGIITPYDITVTARSQGGAEVRMRRQLQTVSVPVFQFGFFSETDLAFHAGEPFTFGGRVHTNGNLFLASANGFTLTLGDRVTALGEVIRTHLPNGLDGAGSYNGTVSMIKATNSFRNLLRTEGSLVTTINSALNEPKWTQTSIGAYNSYIRNGRTGARRLDLPIVSDANGDNIPDANPIELIRRPNPAVADPGLVGQERYFARASLRILLSDVNADIMALPGIVAAQLPVSLAAGNAYGPAGVGMQAPIAASPGQALHGNLPPDVNKFPVNNGMINGVIKIELRNNAGVWSDVTQEILARGIAGRNLALNTGPLAARWNTPGANCLDPHPTAILRIQRVRDVPFDATAVNNAVNNATSCGYTLDAGGAVIAMTQRAADYWPLALYDTREGQMRDGMGAPPAGQTNIMMGGIIHYLELDVNNLRRYFRGDFGGNGNQARNDNGFIVYFSDRRNNRNDLGQETGEYGFEDVVNPPNMDALPEGNGVDGGVPDVGEDLNGNGTLQKYGRLPQGVPGVAAPFPMAPFNGAARPFTRLPAATNPPAPAIGIPDPRLVARANRTLFFRRALKLVNGGNQSAVMPGVGLTIVSENPVYIQGNYNATVNLVPAEAHVPSAVMADAVTLLSNNWNDIRSFAVRQSVVGDQDTDPGSVARPAATTGYRMAIITGKTLAFPRPNWADGSFGSDGGAHNFVRSLENWDTNGTTHRYRGSFVSFYTSRQAVGSFKCCDQDAYNRGPRAWTFDDDFLNPLLLPPGTPMFRDINTLTFRQLLRPTQ